jgi:hypothetical protein
MSFQKVKICRQVQSWSGQTYLKDQAFRCEWLAFAASIRFGAGRGESPSGLTCFSRCKIMLAGEFWEGVRNASPEDANA